MSRLDRDAYLASVAKEARRFRAVLADCDPDARVPACPDWSAADLLWHLAGVQAFWARAVRERPARPEHGGLAAEPPASYGELLAVFDRSSDALLAELTATDPGAEAWTWATDHTVGFILRRQAHEALIHRLDAEQAAGDVTPLDPALAADGVEECLDVIFGGTPDWGRFDPLPHHLAVDLSDTGDRVWVQLGRFTGTDPSGETHDEPDLAVVGDPGTEPDALVTGNAGAVDAWLWRRAADTGIRVEGDQDVYERFRRIVDQPIS